MSKYNDTTGDRLSNTLKGDREKYAKGWDRVFGKAGDVEINMANTDPVEAGEVVARAFENYILKGK